MVESAEDWSDRDSAVPALNRTDFCRHNLWTRLRPRHDDNATRPGRAVAERDIATSRATNMMTLRAIEIFREISTATGVETRFELWSISTQATDRIENVIAALR